MLFPLVLLSSERHIMRLSAGSLVLALCFWSCQVSGDVVFDWATVGNPGNGNDGIGFGAVAGVYRISKHEVTNDQFVEFLNSVATTDSFGGVDPTLYNSNMDITRIGSPGSFSYSVNAGFGPNPVNYVSFFDAMRFVNWLENGQGGGGTEAGVYTIGTGLDETRATNATFFLPSENEWYKAAYHDPGAISGYWDYPTQSNTLPTTEVPPGGANSANLANATGDTTDVGAYTGSTSFYGTFDQAGNVFEWNEQVMASMHRGISGGGWNSDPRAAASIDRNGTVPTMEFDLVGFRVASIPEPSAVLYGCVVMIGLLSRKWKRKGGW